MYITSYYHSTSIMENKEQTLNLTQPKVHI